jgi:hypothetical protein
MSGQLRDARGGAYYRKKIGEGKSSKEALAMPQEARRRRRFQEPHGGLAGPFAQCRLTKRSLERTPFGRSDSQNNPFTHLELPPIGEKWIHL